MKNFILLQSNVNGGVVLGMIIGLALWIWLLTDSYNQGKKRKIGVSWAVIAYLFLSWIGLIIIFASPKLPKEIKNE
jgi:hypothetical protein